MTRFKICGITQADHGVAAIEARASFMGVLLAPSKRQLSRERARDLVRDVRSRVSADGRGPGVVGVFVNSPASEVNEIAEYCGLDWVQIHGDETLEDCSGIERPVLKVVRVQSDDSHEEMLIRLDEEFRAIIDRDYTPMLDSVSTGRYYGGTGHAVDWSIAAELAKRYDFVLSGGLSPENVARAIEQVRPWAVDVSSGVETVGTKDPAKIRAFARAVAEADSRLGQRLGPDTASVHPSTGSG